MNQFCKKEIGEVGYEISGTLSTSRKNKLQMQRGRKMQGLPRCISRLSWQSSWASAQSILSSLCEKTAACAKQNRAKESPRRVPNRAVHLVAGVYLSGHASLLRWT